MTVNRRAFLQTSAAIAFTAASYNRVYGANERLTLGLIGSGGRGKSIMGDAISLKHNCVALADVADFRMEAMTKVVENAGQEKPICVKEATKLLDMKLDGVMIAVPDLHHKDVLVATMKAGKDAYCEKPLTRSLEEGKEMIAAVRDAKRIVQVGNQRHSGPHWKRARDLIQSNDFGELVWAKVWDCRNWVTRDPFAPPKSFGADQIKGINWEAFLGKAPKRDFDPVRYWSWRWYWDYAGGLMTDIGAHQLDIVQWLGNVDAPKSVVANGGNYHFKHWETPDVIHGVWDYGKFAATFAVEFINGADGVGAVFYGTKMTLIADATKDIKVYNTIDTIKPETKPVDKWDIAPNSEETKAHVKNWLDSIVSRKDPNSTIELGNKVVTAAHLANLSYRTGKKIFWDAEKEQVIGS
ncbi:Gfo/Idh/MocA family oxidoreductase [soil metagenome]